MFVTDTPVICILSTLAFHLLRTSVVRAFCCCVFRLSKKGQKKQTKKTQSLPVSPVNHKVCVALLPDCRGPLPVAGQSVLPKGCGEREGLPDEHRVQRLLPWVSHLLARKFGRSDAIKLKA